jgi:hypothetical protein
MTGYKTTRKTCVKSNREKNSRFKLPLEARNIDKVQYFNDTFINALKFHFFAHDLTVPYPVARKVLYDIWYDALKNSNDKIHKKNIEIEYARYLDYFNEHLKRYHDYVRDWEAYRKSELYQETIRTLQEVHRTDHRLKIATDFALAYLYAKYQTRHKYETMITKVEQALHLDVIPRVWSKTSFWLAMQLLVFDPSNLYANTIGNNKVYVSEFDKIKEEAIKIYTTPWYEREDVKLSKEWRNVALVYHELIVPLAGEVGSVALAEAARRGTVISLIHLANGLANLATLHPAMRTVSTVSKILEFAATFLDKSILAWLGWQIGIEWALDGAIQKVLTEFAKYLYSAITGEKIKKGYYTDNELKEVSQAVEMYLKLLKGLGYIDGTDKKLQQWYDSASLKLRYLFDKIVKTIEVREAMFNQLKKAKLKTIEKQELTEKSFRFVCDPSANNFVKTINEAIRMYFEKFEHFRKYINLVNLENNYLANVRNVYSDIHSEFLSIPLLSIYEKHKDEKEFSFGNYKTDCYVFEPPRGVSSVGAGYYIHQFTTLTKEKVLGISLDTFIMIVDPLPAGLYFDCSLYIEIRELSNFDLETDFYKYLTDCTKIENLYLALNQVDENIYVNKTTEKPDILTKYRESNKLKLRKTKRCISVIRKKNKVKTKPFLQQELISIPDRYRKNQIYIVLTFGLYDVLPPKKYVVSQGESYSTLAKLETSLIKESSNKYTYRITAKSEAQKTNYVILSPDGTVWCPYVMAIPRNYNKIYSKEFDRKFNIYLTDQKTKIDRKKSKRSKIICIKKT